MHSLSFDLFISFVFFVPLDNVHSYGVVDFTGEGLQIFIYTRHLWPLNSGGSLTCHAFGEREHPFIFVISEDTHACCRAFGSGAVITCFNKRSVAAGIWTPNILHARRMLKTTGPTPRLKLGEIKWRLILKDIIIKQMVINYNLCKLS